MTKLEALRQYEQAHKDSVSGEERPAFHLSPAVGWLNDPNGFSWYQGKYHLFYQFYPYAPRWNVGVNWGHWTSENLVEWKREPAAMAPDERYETGVFSGSAVTDADGSHLLMYTAHFEEEKTPGEVYRRETQCLARGDGKDYSKDPRNPVIAEKELPADCEISDFRDPKLWIEQDGTYSAILASRDRRTQLGKLLLFQSENAGEWHYVSTILANDGRFGRMWECPDFYMLDGRCVVSASAMAVKNDDPSYRNGYTVLAFIGDYDEQTHRFTAGEPQGLDLGFDFYAPQTMETPDGRRILVAWMQAPETGGNAPETIKWYGMMTFPRELSVRDGHLYQKPVREIEKLHLDTVRADQTLEGETELDGISGRAIDLSVDVTVPEKDAEPFEMDFASDGTHRISLKWDPESGRFLLDRRHDGRSSSVCSVRETVVRPGQTLSLRILLDRFSYEIFVNGGAQVLSGTMYEMPAEADRIAFRSDGARVCAEKHALREVMGAL